MRGATIDLFDFMHGTKTGNERIVKVPARRLLAVSSGYNRRHPASKPRNRSCPSNDYCIAITWVHLEYMVRLLGWMNGDQALPLDARLRESIGTVDRLILEKTRNILRKGKSK
jgi:hypothetical protein